MKPPEIIEKLKDFKKNYYDKFKYICKDNPIYKDLIDNFFDLESLENNKIFKAI